MDKSATTNNAAPEWYCAVEVTSVNPDTGETEVAANSSTHATSAAALTQAANEAFGVAGASWSVLATLTRKQACSAVMASRNNDIYLRLQMAGNYGTKCADANMRAPQVCKLLELFAPDTVQVLYKPGTMLVF